MMHTIRQKGMLALMLGGLLAATAFMAGPAQAATSNGPYYAEPAWDQKLAAATRFVVLLDWSSEAVLDRETGLVWEQAPQTTVASWYAARSACTAKVTGNRKGWRLPSVHELASLIDPSVAAPSPTLPAGHPFTIVQSTSTVYWSATTNAAIATDAWNLFFGSGGVSTINKSTSLQVWCVRGGSNADVY
jgi:hypothetical protein